MMEKSNPKISVILPVYNGEEYLEESIQSILNQTFRDFEFIIINDGSKDGTESIIKKYQKIDKRMILINNKKNIGSSESMNLGLKNARGKYIACFCADDISHPKRLEKEFNYLEKNTHIFLVGTSGIYIDEKGREIRRFRKYDNYKLLEWRLRKSCSIIFPSIMFRKEDTAYFDKEFVPADDYKMYFDLIKKGKKITNLPQFLVKIRVHEKSMSNMNNKRQEEARLRVINKFKTLKNNVNFLERIYFYSILFIHFIKTRNEKKIKQNLLSSI